MAINFDHTQSASITLKGQSGSLETDSFTFILPTITSNTGVLLVDGVATINSIDGLQAILNNKVSVGGSSGLTGIQTGTSVGQIPVLNDEGKLDIKIIPSFAIRDTFLVDTTGDVINLSSAQLGDLAIATGSKLNLILNATGSGAYSGIQNWKSLQTSQQSIHSVNGLIGHVILDGSNVCVSSGNYLNKSLNYSIEDLKTSKASLESLMPFASTGYVTGQLENYATLTGLTGISGSGGILNSYLTVTGFNSQISGYQTITGLQNALSGYVGTGEVGTVSRLNYGTSSGNVVVLESDGKINAALLPKIAITDTFILSSTGGLTSLNAQKGDIGIITGTVKGNYILSGTDPTLITDWQSFAVPTPIVSSVNGLYPENGSVTLRSSNIYVNNTSGNNYNFDDQTVSYTLTGLAQLITGLGDSYLNSGKATTFLQSYVTTGYATGVFNSKSNTGHTHGLADVINLQTCLNSIAPFVTGEALYSMKQKASDETHNMAKGQYSVAMGYGAVACQDYEIAHAAGWFAADGLPPGSAQTSKILFRCITTASSPSQIACICMEAQSTISYSADVVGFGSANRYASFKVEGTACKGAANNTVDMLGGNSLTTYTNTNHDYHISGVADTLNGNIVINVSGVGDHTNWITNINILKVRNLS